MSNLYKASWVSVNSDDARIIDNNDLADQKILRFREEEKRQRTEDFFVQQAQAAAEGGSDGFAALDADQLQMLTADRPEGMDYGDGDMPDATGGASEEDLQAAQEQVDAMLADAQAQADEILSQAQAQANILQNQARDAGHQEGYEAGYREGAAAAAALQADMEQQIENQRAEVQRLRDSIEPEMVDTLTQIYEHVFAVNLSEDHDMILHLLQTALGRIEPGGDILIHISPDDYDRVTDAKDRLQENVTSPNISLEIAEDPLLHENEAIIETDGGVFDCSVGVELEELGRKLRLLSFERKRDDR